MRPTEPDCSAYKEEDLGDLAGHIKREARPERWSRIQFEIARRRKGAHRAFDESRVGEIPDQKSGEGLAGLTIRESQKLHKRTHDRYMAAGVIAFVPTSFAMFCLRFSATGSRASATSCSSYVA